MYIVNTLPSSMCNIKFFTESSPEISVNWVFPECFSLNIQWIKNFDVKVFKPVTSCVRDDHATTVQARHRWETGSFNWTHFMLQWFYQIPWIHWICLPFRQKPPVSISKAALILVRGEAIVECCFGAAWFLLEEQSGHNWVYLCISLHRCLHRIHEFVKTKKLHSRLVWIYLVCTCTVIGIVQDLALFQTKIEVSSYWPVSFFIMTWSRIGRGPLETRDPALSHDATS